VVGAAPRYGHDRRITSSNRLLRVSPNSPCQLPLRDGGRWCPVRWWGKLRKGHWRRSSPASERLASSGEVGSGVEWPPRAADGSIPVLVRGMSGQGSEVELRGKPGDTDHRNAVIKSGGGTGPVKPRQPSRRHQCLIDELPSGTSERGTKPK